MKTVNNAELKGEGGIKTSYLLSRVGSDKGIFVPSLDVDSKALCISAVYVF